jgi:hypothetical protein
LGAIVASRDPRGVQLLYELCDEIRVPASRIVELGEVAEVAVEKMSPEEATRHAAGSDWQDDLFERRAKPDREAVSVADRAALNRTNEEATTADLPPDGRGLNRLALRPLSPPRGAS